MFLCFKDRWTILLLVVSIAMAHELCGVSATIGAGSLELTREVYTPHIHLLYSADKSSKIILDNGSVWLSQRPILWFVGDTLSLEYSQSGWVLHNAHTGQRADVRLQGWDSSGELRIEKVSHFGGEIRLNDGSRWALGWWQRQLGKSYEWKAGDELLVMPVRSLVGRYTHVLITKQLQPFFARKMPSAESSVNGL